MADVQRSAARGTAYFPGDEALVPTSTARPDERTPEAPEMGVASTDLVARVDASVVDPGLELDRHAVAMTLSTFLVTLAAAALYHGASSPSAFAGYFAFGVACLLVAASLALVARWRLRRAVRSAPARSSGARSHAN